MSSEARGSGLSLRSAAAEVRQATAFREAGRQPVCRVGPNGRTAWRSSDRASCLTAVPGARRTPGVSPGLFSPSPTDRPRASHGCIGLWGFQFGNGRLFCGIDYCGPSGWSGCGPRRSTQGLADRHDQPAAGGSDALVSGGGHRLLPARAGGLDPGSAVPGSPPTSRVSKPEVPVFIPIFPRDKADRVERPHTPRSLPNYVRGPVQSRSQPTRPVRCSRALRADTSTINGRRCAS